MNATKYESFRKVVVWIARLYFLYMAYMLLHPRPPVPRPLVYIPDILHIGAFGILGGLVALARNRWSSLRWYPLLLIWGVVAEATQPYTGRYFEWMDMAQNVVGVTLGLWITTRLRAKFVKDANEAAEFDENKEAA